MQYSLIDANGVFECGEPKVVDISAMVNMCALYIEI